jgi:hypothetical protein
LVLSMLAGAMKAVPSPAVSTVWVPLAPMLHCKVWPTTSYIVPA